jgi:hypothetical protein
VYLITNNVRRWVATVVISDDDLNAYPEAEPIYAAMAPFGGGSSGSTAAAKPAASPAPAAPAPAAGAAPAASAPAPAATADPAGTVKPTGDTCPAGHDIKGATTNNVKTYYEPERPEYASIKPEVCFTAGGDARNAGYKSAKQ